MQSKFNEKGYVLIKNLLNPKKLIKIQKDIKRIFANYLGKSKIEEKDIFGLFESDREAYVNCCKLSHNLLSVHALSVDKKIINVLKKIGLNQPAISMRPVLFLSSKKIATKKFYWKTDPHQDYYLMRTGVKSVVCWVPTCYINKNLGYLEILPGRSEILEHEFDGQSAKIKNTMPDEKFVSVKMNLGDALIFSSSVIHRSGLNISDKIRWAVNLRYCDLADESFIKEKFELPYEYRHKNKV